MADTQGPIPESEVRRQPAGVQRGARPGAQVQSKQEKHKLPAPSFPAIFWPVVVGVVLAFFAHQLRQMLSPYEPWGSMVVFPFVLLAGRQELGISQELANNLPQFVQMIQFPVEGLLTMWNLSKRTSLGKAIAQLCFLHFLGFFILWLLAQQGGVGSGTN